MASTTVPASGGSYSFNASEGTQEFFYMPDTSGSVKIYTTGDANADTYIDLYTYPAFSYIADDDSSGQDGTHASITATLTAGVNYVFYVQRYPNTATFNYTLTVEPGEVIPPPEYTASNDNFSAAMPLGDDPAVCVPVDSTGATTEVEEWSPNAYSTWYSWTAGPEDGREFTYTPASADPKDAAQLRPFTVHSSFPNPTQPNEVMRAASWIDPNTQHRVQVKTTPGVRYWMQVSAPNGSYGSWQFGTLCWQHLIWGPWEDSGVVERLCDTVHLSRQSGGVWGYPEGGIFFTDERNPTGYYGPPTDNGVFAPALIRQIPGIAWSRHPDNNTGQDPPVTNPPDVGVGNRQGWQYGTTDSALRVSNNWSAQFPGGPIYTDGRPIPWEIGSTIEQSALLFNVRASVLYARARPPVTQASVGAFYEADQSYVDPTLPIRVTAFGTVGRSSDPWDLEVRRLPPSRRAPEDAQLAEGFSEPFVSSDFPPLQDVGIGRGRYGTGVRSIQERWNDPFKDRLIGNFNWIPREEHADLPLIVSVPSTTLHNGVQTVVADTVLDPSVIDAQGWVGIVGLHSMERLGQWSTGTNIEHHPDPNYVKGRDNWSSVRCYLQVRVPTRIRKLIPGTPPAADGYWPSHPQVQDPEWDVPSVPIALDRTTIPKATKIFLPQYPVDDVYSTKFPTNNGAVVPARIV